MPKQQDPPPPEAEDDFMIGYEGPQFALSQPRHLESSDWNLETVRGLVETALDAIQPVFGCFQFAVKVIVVNDLVLHPKAPEEIARAKEPIVPLFYDEGDEDRIMGVLTGRGKKRPEKETSVPFSPHVRKDGGVTVYLRAPDPVDNETTFAETIQNALTVARLLERNGQVPDPLPHWLISGLGYWYRNEEPIFALQDLLRLATYGATLAQSEDPRAWPFHDEHIMLTGLSVVCWYLSKGFGIADILELKVNPPPRDIAERVTRLKKR